MVNMKTIKELLKWLEVWQVHYHGSGWFRQIFHIDKRNKNNIQIHYFDWAGRWSCSVATFKRVCPRLIEDNDKLIYDNFMTSQDIKKLDKIYKHALSIY